MEFKRRERRSSLKHTEPTGSNRFGSSVETSRVNRRISFCGRKSVREFHSEEKPKTWNTSYEISDHINPSDGSSEGYIEGTVIQGKQNKFLLDYKENISKNSSPGNKTLYGRKSLQTLNKGNEYSCIGEENAKTTDKGVPFYENGNKVAENALKNSELTYCGNDAMLVDDKSRIDVNKRISLIHSVEMDISNEENAIRQSFSNNDMVHDGKIEGITKYFKDQLTSVPFDTMDKGNKVSKRISTNKNVTMDISMNVEERVKRKDVLNTESYDYKYSGSVAENTSLPHSTKITLIPESQNHQFICEDSIIKSKSHGSYLTLNSLSNVKDELDEKSNILSCFSFNSPLFPPIMNKKFNLRQLNDDIGGGKIVVFPNKNMECQIPNICVDSKNNMESEGNNRKCLKKKRDKINERNTSDCTQNGDMVSDSTSFLVKGKVDDETVLGNHSLCFDHQYRINTIHCNSEIDTNYSSVAEFAQENNRSTLDMEKNSPLLKTDQFDNNFKYRGRSIYGIQDMNLNGTNFQNITNDISKSIDIETAEISIIGIDVAFRNNVRDSKKKHTIYFDQDIDSTLDLPSVSEISLKSQSCNNKIIDEIKNEVCAVKCTPISKNLGSKLFLMRRKTLETSDCGTNSFTLNLKEARTALSSNCKQRFEGTPQRSFLEFVYLEREVEQDNNNSFESECIEKTINVVEKIREENELSEESNQEHLRKNEENQDKEIVLHKSTDLNMAGLKPIEIKNSVIPMELSPISCQIINKRPTNNFYPNLPLPKKRQTLIFHDLAMDESKCFDKMLTTSGDELSLKSDTFPASKCKHFDYQPANEYGKCSYPVENPSIKSDVCNQIQSEKGAFVDLENVNVNEQKQITLNSASPSKLNNSIVVDVSIDTIQMPRRDAVFTEIRNSNIKLPLPSHDIADYHNIGNISSKIKNHDVFENGNSKKRNDVFEDNAITISDVSAHYSAQWTLDFANVVKNDDKYELPDSEKTAEFNKQLINLELEHSSLCISQIDEIDKTRLSLVETLSENADDDKEKKELYNSRSYEEVEVVQHCTADNYNYVPVEVCSTFLEGKNKAMHITAHKAKNPMICRRCKRCQENFTPENMSATTESFVLPPMPPFPSLGLERLERLYKHPKLKEVHEYWRRKSLENKSANLSASYERIMDMNGDQKTDFMNGIFVKEIEEFKRMENLVNELKVKTIQTDMFFRNLNETLSEELPKWVLNYQLRTKKIMRFIHKKYISFSIEMHYEDKDQLGNNIFIQDVSLTNGRVPTKYWKPIDHILDFNLKVNLPLDLKSLLSGSKINVMKMLRSIDEICTKVAKDCLSLWRLVCHEEASLITNANRMFVQKIEHFVERGGSYSHPFVGNTEFRIEVNNIRGLSAKDIVSPPIYTLTKELQFLPTGIDFIEKFLEFPSKYLKQ